MDRESNAGQQLLPHPPPERRRLPAATSTPCTCSSFTYFMCPAERAAPPRRRAGAGSGAVAGRGAATAPPTAAAIAASPPLASNRAPTCTSTVVADAAAAAFIASRTPRCVNTRAYESTVKHKRDKQCDAQCNTLQKYITHSHTSAAIVIARHTSHNSPSQRRACRACPQASGIQDHCRCIAS